MRVLVLGGYGLVGSEIVRRLHADGFDVVGFGRSAAKGKRLAPSIGWFGADLSTLKRAKDWTPFLEGIDAIVNASGALQTGAEDKLEFTQDRAIRALIEACGAAGIGHFVQISAPGAEASATTEFLRTKARADAALRESRLDWTILKPGLVMSAYAYGGTALLRVLAAFPVVQPLMLPQATVQAVAAEDVAAVVAVALTTERLRRQEVDLVERTPHSLLDVIVMMRAWLGFSPARTTIIAPPFIGAIVGRCADFAGWLGWRSPLRTTALTLIASGVIGDPDAAERALGRPLKTLAETLDALPATMQERTFARAQLVFPLLVLMLAAFWIASGAIALAHVTAAAALLTGTPLENEAKELVIGGALVDIIIGVGLCIRAATRLAAWSAIAVSLSYLALGTLTTPHLWTDPLGAFVKVIPEIGLALVVAALAEER